MDVHSCGEGGIAGRRDGEAAIPILVITTYHDGDGAPLVRAVGVEVLAIHALVVRALDDVIEMRDDARGDEGLAADEGLDGGAGARRVPGLEHAADDAGLAPHLAGLQLAGHRPLALGQNRFFCERPQFGADIGGCGLRGD